MATFARIDKNNIVQSVIIINDEDMLNEHGVEEEDFGIVHLNKTYGVGLTWVQTSYNANFRKNYAGIGYTYDKERDAFISPKPHESWTLDEDTCLWQAPVTKPEDKQGGPFYHWNEDTQAWDKQE
tara:strand:- start:59 stop:433 length:375 start_codon:yes stop_codon:yes gene_type:complete